LVNDDYSIKSLKNDFMAHFEPDDRGDMERWFIWLRLN
jgi:hypothetical protein